ncbi:hypothetical protein K0A97_00385 [Patescibacteria group bacterium]|nr:hypothetical protein [Patescibacteria group bacterium]
MVKTIQLGLRIDKNLNKEIEYLAESEGVNKMAWIRRALADFVDQEKNVITKELVKGYINLINTEKDLKEFTGWNKMPEDISQARRENINSIKRTKE